MLLKGRLPIEAAQEISDPKRGWICDLFDSMIERSLPDISRLNRCTESIMAPAVPRGPTKKLLGFRFLCGCPQVVPLRTSGIVDGNSAREGIHLLMIEIPELC